MPQTITTKITAHSGAELTIPNSLSSIRHAMEYGADGIEVDIRKVNNELVLSHDVPICKVPTVKEMFELIKDTTLYVNCDLKHGGMVDEIIMLAKEYGIETSRLMFTGGVSLDDPKRVGEAKIFINIEGMPYEGLEEAPLNYDSLIEVAKQCEQAGVAGLNMDFHVVDKKVIDICNQYNLLSTVWTVDRSKHLIEMLALNVYSITTNTPKKAMKIRHEMNAVK